MIKNVLFCAGLLLQRKIEFDRSGRLSIPQSLREYAGLSGECTILGINKYMELWDSASYRDYLEKTESSFQQAAESMSEFCCDFNEVLRGFRKWRLSIRLFY